MKDRIKPFKTILNFRDFGAYETVEGAKVVRDKLYRSAHLNNLDDNELAAIGKMDIGLVVDLRHAPERKRQPSRYPLESEARVLAYPDRPDGESAKVAPHEAFMEHELNSAQDAHDYMMKSYAQRSSDKGFQEIFRDTLLHMSNTGEPILVHCAAGKDRTGTLVALIQGLLGVPDHHIRDDYMLTNEAVNIESFLEPAAQMFTKRYGRTFDADALRPMFGVTQAFLDAALAQMGDIYKYANDELGIPKRDIERLRAHYLN